MTTQQAGAFKPLDLPGGERAWIPSDLDLVVPETTAIAADLLHYLIYIPWNPRYLERVDAAYRDFFSLMLPYLRARTTDVHVATCLPFARELIREHPESVEERVVHVAFILHDSGWSQMSEAEIAASLGVAGLALSGGAVAPKLRHVELARDLAVRILGEYPFVPPLTDEQKEMIYTAILFHDKPEELAAMGGVPAAIQVVCDTDHLWSFTHENFWQDTVRKGVHPPAYLDNLGEDLDGYFVTPAGKRRAARMLQERAAEVRSWQEWVDRAGGSPPGARAAGAPPLEGFETPIADVSHVERKWLDIAYAHTSLAQQLDIYLPESGAGPFPVLLNIHGGGFAIGDKRDTHILAFLRSLHRGYGVVSVNYRLSGEAIFPAGLQDVKAAIRWLRAHGHEYSLDASRIVAWGGSSGGNYAAMVAATAGDVLFDDPALGNEEHACDVQVAVDWFGPTDFLTMDEQLAESGLGPSDHSDALSPESRYLGAPIGEIPDRVGLASPMTYVGEHMAPILIQHGRADNLVPFQQSVQLAAAIKASAGGERFELDIFDGAGHDDPVFESDQNLDRVFEFIERHLG